MPKAKKTNITINLNKENLTPTELNYLQRLIDKKERQHQVNEDYVFKIRKTTGIKRNRRRRNLPAHKIDNNTFVHLKDYSLIQFPGSDRYYVIGKELAKGPRGKVKVLPYYFIKDADGNLVRKKSDEEEIIKIIKSKPQADNREMTKAKNRDEAQQEAIVARDAGKLDAVSGVNPDPESISAYIKMPKAKGMDLEKYLQTHRDISLQERLTIIKLIIAELEKIHAAGYFYIDLKPDNIFYDGQQITFVDWGSAGIAANVSEIPESPLFASKTRDSNAAQREAYALAGLTSVILSEFDSNNQTYNTLPVLKRKNKTTNLKQRIAADYDFSTLLKPFKLPKNSKEENAFNTVIDNLTDMGSHDVNKRDPIFKNDYATLKENINKLEFHLKNAWIKKITNAFEKVYLPNVLDKSVIDNLNTFGQIDVSTNKMTDLDQVVQIIGNIIEQIALKQKNRISGSAVLKAIKKNLPPEVFSELTDEQRKQLNQFSSVNFTRFFHKKSARNSMEFQEGKSNKIRSTH